MRRNTSDRGEDDVETEEEASDEDYDAAIKGDVNPSALLKQIKTTLSSEKGRLSNAMVCRCATHVSFPIPPLLTSITLIALNAQLLAKRVANRFLH